MSFAQTTGSRFGTAVKVERIEPVEYSALIKRTPSTAIASCATLTPASAMSSGWRLARSVIGGAVYVMLVGIFALAIGAIVRNTAGGIAAFAGIFFVLPPLMFVLPTSWNNAISQYLPSEAGRQLFALQHASHTLRPLTGGLVFAGYCAAAIVIAAVLLVRRDV